MRALLFHNPKAGDGRVSKRDLLAACRLAGLSATYCSTKEDDVEKHLLRSTDLIIVAGGDGTVSQIVCKLPDCDIPVAIVPLGNANNIARSLGISGSPQELAETWTLGHTQALDIGEVVGRWGRRKFVEAVGLGALAYAVKNGSKRKKKGADNLRQGRDALRKALQHAEPFELSLSIDKQKLEGSVLAVEVTSLPYAGPGLPLAPTAKPADALFDVVCVRPTDLEALLPWIETPQRSPIPLQIERGRDISFDWQDILLRIDDDTFKAGDHPEVVTIAPACEKAKIVVSAKEGERPRWERA
jgi:diacylglycerol kinase (ATP)